MSDHLPDLHRGDRIRVMQTRDMERAGLANKRGTIIRVTGDGSAVVDLDLPGRLGAVLPLHSLMRESSRLTIEYLDGATGAGESTQ